MFTMDELSSLRPHLDVWLDGRLRPEAIVLSLSASAERCSGQLGSLRTNGLDSVLRPVHLARL